MSVGAHSMCLYSCACVCVLTECMYTHVVCGHVCSWCMCMCSWSIYMLIGVCMYACMCMLYCMYIYGICMCTDVYLVHHMGVRGGARG